MKHHSIDLSTTHGTYPTLHVMGVPLVNAKKRNAIREILTPGRRVVSFLNAHCVNVASSDQNYAAALQRSDLVLPDGIGIEIAAKMQGDAIVENLNGTDLTPDLLKVAARKGLKVFLLGGKPGTAEAAANAICDKIPDLQIAGTRNGYEGVADPIAAIDHINRSGADILLVAMGVPLQELWLDRHKSKLKPRISMAVGGLFDFWAGNVRRAPKVVRQVKMEWMWRLLMEPRRMAKRYLIGNISFLMRAARAAMRGVSGQDVTKIMLDKAISLTVLTLLGPMLLCLMTAIKLESKGPALFRQTRIGKNGKPFRIYKLRSMYIDAEARRAALLSQSDRSGVCFKSKNDPRITRVGKFVRRYSLDELPQIINVLRGEMSVVGPRPALPEEVAAYPTAALQRLAVRPGLTGLWQVSGRADIGFTQMVEMDVAYVQARSSWLDLMLMCLTFRAVFSGRGAY